jgi:hypothetical protein
LILFRQPFLLRDAILFSLGRAFSFASLRGFAAKLRADRGKGYPGEGCSKRQDQEQLTPTPANPTTLPTSWRVMG